MPRLSRIDELKEDMKKLGMQNWKETANDEDILRSHMQQAVLFVLLAVFATLLHLSQQKGAISYSFERMVLRILPTEARADEAPPPVRTKEKGKDPLTK